MRRAAVVFFLIIQITVPILFAAAEAASGSPVKFLPGFDGGPLPFQLQTGSLGYLGKEEV
ncbi:unnamed protein product, partial [Cuscuta campestris]